MIKSLYVHIPFCLQKCLYCDFNSYTTLSLQYGYVDALKKELGYINQSKFDTIFIGGGTPTILSIQSLEKLLKEIQRFSASEYTIECNPGTLTKEKLELMNYYGINRLSIGLQAFQDNLLQKLGRIHNVSEFIQSYEAARKYGFNNINIDLMFGIPDQNIDEWGNTIEKVNGLKPEHISCYSLIIEEGTPFYKAYSEDSLVLADEETERQMYYLAVKNLLSSGYRHYEISNFAKAGYECRHNITYWHADEYYGVGAGAHSYIGKSRYSNLKDIKSYISNMNENNAVETVNNLSPEDELSEFMFLGLRMTEGIKKSRFENRFGSNINTYFNDEINDLIKKGLLIDNGEYIRLSSRGIDISNQVFLRFLK